MSRVRLVLLLVVLLVVSGIVGVALAVMTMAHESTASW